MRLTRLTPLVILTLLSTGTAQADPAPVTADNLAATPIVKGPWQVIKNEQGIVVQRRKVSGSNLAEFQGRGVVDAPIARVFAVLADDERATEWMHKCTAAGKVEMLGEGSEVVYNRTGAPWPVADRDVVLRADTIFDGAAHQIRIDFHEVNHPRMQPIKGVVRMPFLRGHWYLWPEGQDKTRVEYQAHADAGGQLPNWIANLVSKEIPYRTILDLRAQLKKRTYPEFERTLAARPEFQAVIALPAAANPPAVTP